LVIVGRGPDGLVAAIYAREEISTLGRGLSRLGRTPAADERGEKFIGYPIGVLSPEVMGDLRRQAE
jgi:thioredoxin reductase